MDLYTMDVLHKWLWTELAETGGIKDDSDFFNGASGYAYLSYENETFLYCGCSACHYTDQDCPNCPYDWPVNRCGKSVCDGGGGLWSKCNYAYTRERRKYIAARIRDLPLKPKYQKMLDEEE